MSRRLLLAAAVCAAVAWLPACRAKRVELPTGAGEAFPAAAAAYDAAVRECREVRTMAATLSLSGRAGSTGLRGNVDAGFEAPDRLRLEGRHPIGRPVFILAAGGTGATLYFPRDNRVLLREAPDRIVEALVGLPLGPSELRALVAGCGFGAQEPGGGRRYPGGWVAVDTGDATAWLREMDGRWRVAAATRGPLTVFYSRFTGGRPGTLRLQSRGEPAADITVKLSDVNINLPLAPAAFAVDVPAGAEPMTLDELRRAGPLGDG